MATITAILPMGCPCCDAGCTGCDACALDPDPECCTPCPTPDQITITIDDMVCSPKCSFDTAPHYHVHVLDVSLMIGRSFIIPYTSGCTFTATFTVTSWVRMLSCNGSSGAGCAGCTPTTDVTASSTMTVTWSPGFGLTFTFHLTTSDPELDNNPLGMDLYTYSADDPDPTGHTCCDTWSGASNPSGPDGTEDPYTIYMKSVSVVPC